MPPTNPVLEDLFKRFGITPQPVGLRVNSGMPKYNPTLSDTPLSGGQGFSDRNIETHRIANEVQTNLLNSQVERQKNAALELTGEEHEPKQPGTLERILDVLSRPNYAIAEGTRQVIKDAREDNDGFNIGEILDRTGDFASGAWQGLQGREKSNFNRAIQEAGVEANPATAILGFVGDVAFDPTTYLTLGTGAVAKGALTQGTRGLAKNVIEEAAEGYAAGAARELLEDPTNIKHVDEMVQQRIQRQQAQGLQEGGPKVKVPTDAKLRKMADEEFANDIANVVAAQKDEFLRHNQRTFDVKLGSRSILPDSVGRKIYDASSAITSPLFNNRTAQAFQSFLSPKANYGILHSASRIHEGQGVAAFERNLEAFREEVKHLTRQESRDISFALENGTLLPGEHAEIQQSVRKLLDNFWEDEVAMGLHKEADSAYRQNYVPHYFQRGSEEKIDAFNKRVRNLNNAKMTSEHQRTYDLLKEAEEAGLKPITDIREIVARRAADHYRKKSTINFLNEALSNYGIATKGKNGKPLRGANRTLEKFKESGVELVKTKPFRHLDGAEFWVPKEVKGVFDMMDKTLYQSEAARHILRRMDKVQNAIKTGFTVMVPGHHIRNLVGDIFLNFEDGVLNPKRYTEAARIAAGRGAAPSSALRQGLNNKSMMIGGRKYTYHEISQLYDEMGLRSGYFDVELARKATRSARHPVEAARDVATGREDMARIAHFIDVLKKEGARGGGFKNKHTDIRKVAKEAAERVRKFNLDYGDLTEVEKTVARRMFLFYTFFRKNLPLQLEMMATRPGKVQMATDLENLIEGIAGVENDDPKLERSIPDWIREMGAIQLTDGRNPTYSTMQLPTADLNRVSNNPSEIFNEVISMLTPYVKVPIELGMEKQAFSGGPIGGTAEYGVNQLPFGSMFRKQKESLEEGEGLDVQTLINMLTGIGLQPVTEERRRGELRRQQDVLQSVIGEARKKRNEEIFGR